MRATLQATENYITAVVVKTFENGKRRFFCRFRIFPVASAHTCTWHFALDGKIERDPLITGEAETIQQTSSTDTTTEVP